MRSWCVFCLAASIAFSPPASAQESPAPDPESALTLTPVEVTAREGPRVTVAADSGVLRVPARHADPDGRQIEISFLRYPSTSPDPGPPIVYLAGGAGGTGTGASTGDRFPLFMKLREAGDVIALDQRGVAGTPESRVCSGRLNYPLDRPVTEATVREAMRTAVEGCAAELEDDLDPRAFNTIESADDLDALRRVLGAERISLLGISYGTHLGLTYIRRYPGHVHRAVLAGVEGPDDTYKLPSQLDGVVIALDSLIEADPAARRLVPDLLGPLESLLDELDSRPRTVRVDVDGEATDVVLSGWDVRGALYGKLGEREDIAGVVPLLARVLGGDLTPIAEHAIDARSGRLPVMPVATDCASGVSPARLSRIRDEEATAFMGEVATLELRVLCDYFPHEKLGAAFTDPVRSDTPVLFISGTLDPRTPVRNAEAALSGFPNGHHLRILGGSHDDDLLIVRPGIGEQILRFLGGREPTRDSVDLGPLKFVLPRSGEGAGRGGGSR